MEVLYLVREVGVEPTCRWPLLLKQLRIPFRHTRKFGAQGRICACTRLLSGKLVSSPYLGMRLLFSPPRLNLVREMGLEPTCHWPLLLKQLRIPFHHTRKFGAGEGS